jgi:acetylornithine deacetylase
VPGEDKAEWEARYREKVAQVQASMQSVVPETRIELQQRYDVPALTPEEHGEAEQMARSLTGDNGTHVVSYGTEAGQFQKAGYSAVICGPGDIAQAHQPNEYIRKTQFEAGHAFMNDLIARLQR